MSEETQYDGKKNKTFETASGMECGTQCDASTYVSQVNSPAPVTASSGPPREATKWICELCTYENFPLSRKCTMCLSPKPLLGEDIFTLQDAAAPPARPAPPVATDGASALPACPPSPPQLNDHQGADCELSRLRIASSPAAPPATPPATPAHDKWPCVRCTYENWPRSLKCAMCGADSPQPAAPHPAHSPPPAPRTPIGINELCHSQSVSLLDPDAKLRSKRKHADWIWLQACLGVVDGSADTVETYLSAGGDPARALTHHEVALLNRASAFGPGHTLVHLAIRFQREDILAMLLSRISGGGPGLKRSPSYIAPDLATAIRRHVSSCLRTKRQGPFHCTYVNEFTTFALPQEIEELPAAIQEQLFAELLDRDAQHTLEADPPLINWSLHLTLTLGSRLYALWNRSAGDCLLDAVLQAAYGVFDRDSTLRAALADTLHHGHRSFYERWVGWERLQASLLHYQPEDSQLRSEWARLLSAAARPGTPLHQVHVFALAHVMRRPIIVYGVNVVHSFRGEALGYAKYQGIYLPLLWEPEHCSKSPLCVGYTRGHFSALVPVEPYSRHYICDSQRGVGTGTREEDGECCELDGEGEECVYLPLCDAAGKPLPVHFLTRDEMVEEERLVRRWVDACATRGGLPVARQTAGKRPLLVAQMLEEWLNHYRTIAQQTRGPFPPRLPAEFSSDPDTDEE